MKKQLLLLVMMRLPLVANADAVKINGIYYTSIAKVNVAEVTSKPNKYSGIFVIPEAVSYQDVSYSVTSIGKAAFNNCPGLTSVTIPNCVTKIDDRAFEYCSGLTSITIPNSVTTMGVNAFANSGLTSITIPNSLTTLNSYTFAWCIHLTSITIPNSVTCIGEYNQEIKGKTNVEIIPVSA